MLTVHIQHSYSVNRPAEVSIGLDIRREELGAALSNWLRRDTQRSTYPAAGYPPPGGYPIPIYSTALSYQSNAPYVIWIYPISCTRYRPGGVFSGTGTYCGVRIAPIDLKTAGYHLGGIPYRAPISFSFGANSYAARFLSNP